jgi:gamma-glutamyltranspeptidase/glutathione hydrolase
MIDLSFLIKVILPAVVFAGVILAADRPAGNASAGRSVVLARNGMVAASQPLAAQAGLRILQRGGNAVDAAVATAAALAVVEPMMTGPGGDMFALAWMAKSKKLVGLNGSGFSPEAATMDFFKKRGMESMPATGAMAVSIPCAVDGWATLLEAHGTMSLAEVLAPAIEYAEQGYPVS